MTKTEPKPSRPLWPKGYGIPKSKTGLLSWSHVEQRMSAAHNYWVCTTRPDGHPHAMPVWGVWVAGKFCFSTDRQSRKSRNLIRLPAIVVHLESGDDVVILEGRAEEIKQPKLLSSMDDAYHAKYGLRVSEVPGTPAIYAVTPKAVFAWREKDFPTSATRWLLGSR